MKIQIVLGSLFLLLPILTILFLMVKHVGWKVTLQAVVFTSTLLGSLTAGSYLIR